jgi:hypothetical protein
MRFQVLQAGLQVWDCDVTGAIDQPYLGEELDEHKAFQFVVRNREPNVALALLVGDDEAEENFLEGSDHLSDVIWPSLRYFESCVSSTSINVYSRSTAIDSGAWKRVLHVTMRINPSKITRSLYEAMVEDLRSVSASLIFDVVSKSSRRVGFGAISKRVAALPTNIELRRLERLYSEVAERLHEVAANPSRRLVNEREYRTIDSTVVFDAGACATLAARGFDVRSLALGRRQTGWVRTRKERTNTVENGIILGFLGLLADRFRQCALRAQRQALVLADIKPYRERADGSTPLFDSEEMPRIRRLEAIRDDAQRLGSKVRGMRKLNLFLECSPRHDLRMTYFGMCLRTMRCSA